MTLQCDICGGTGKNPHNPSEYCRACECQVFSRKEVEANRKRFGESKMTEHCERCQGSGKPCKPLALEDIKIGHSDFAAADLWKLHEDNLKRIAGQKFCIGCCGWVRPNPDNSLPCGH